MLYMIVFNAKSACYISQIFESENITLQNEIFFNDGIKNRQITEVKRLNQDFEANGMFQSIFTGYRLLLEDGCEFEIDILKSITKFIQRDSETKPNKLNYSTEPNDLNDWIDASINKYMF